MVFLATNDPPVDEQLHSGDAQKQNRPLHLELPAGPSAMADLFQTATPLLLILTVLPVAAKTTVHRHRFGMAPDMWGYQKLAKRDPWETENPGTVMWIRKR
jgi:hypothetical protein